MILYEIYYHDAWRSHSSYGRQEIFTTEEEAKAWKIRVSGITKMIQKLKILLNRR